MKNPMILSSSQLSSGGLRAGVVRHAAGAARDLPGFGAGTHQQRVRQQLGQALALASWAIY